MLFNSGRLLFWYCIFGVCEVFEKTSGRRLSIATEYTEFSEYSNSVTAWRLDIMPCYLPLVFHLRIWPWVEILGSYRVLGDNFAGWSTISEDHSSKLLRKMGICPVVTTRPFLFLGHWGNIANFSDFMTSCIFYSVHHLPCPQRFIRVIGMKRIV